MISAPVPREPDRCPGALTLHEAADGQLARVRLPGGFVTGAALIGLAELAERFADGRLELTSRGNVQLRAIRPGEAEQLAIALAELGLLPSLTHERVRNIVASPLAGLDRPGPSLQELVRRLDHALCGTAELAALSGRFLFAVDDGRGDTRVLRPDVAVTWVREDVWELSPGDVQIGPDEVVPGVITLARAFLAERAAQHSTAWHVRDLVEGAERVAARAALTPTRSARAGRPRLRRGTSEHYVVAVVPLGRLTAVQARRLAAIAGADAGAGAGAEPLRITPNRRVVAPLASGVTAEAAITQLTEAGLASEGDSIWENLTACAGQPGCAKALADVQRDAARAARDNQSAGPAHQAGRAGHVGQAGPAELDLPEHWSGCSRRCGHPRGRYLDVLAGPDGYTRTVIEAEVPEPESVRSR